MSYLDEHGEEVRNSSYYRRELKKVQAELTELKAKLAMANVTEHREMKYKEIEWLKECVTVSNNDTLYYRGRWEEAEKEIESLHDHLAAVIGQREELK